jgi:hypothetical protein
MLFFTFKFYFTLAKEEQNKKIRKKKLAEDSRSSLYPSKNVLGRCYIALKRFHCKGRLTMQKKKKEKRKKIELSTFRREPSHRASTSPSAKRILNENTLLVQCIIIIIIIIFILFSYVFFP